MGYLGPSHSVYIGPMKFLPHTLVGLSMETMLMYTQGYLPQPGS